MNHKNLSNRSPVKREGAERYIFLSLISFAASVIMTRTFLELTGYPQLGNGTLHIAHVLWGGLLLFIAALLPLIFANRWVLNLSAILSGVGVGLFIDEVGKFITQTNDYFYPPAAPIIYAFFLLTVLLYLNVRRPDVHTPRGMMYRVLEDMTEILDRDLDPHERASIDRRLEIIAAESDDPNLSDLVAAINRFVDGKHLILTKPRPHIGQRIGDRVVPILTKALNQRRLKAFLILSMGVMGVLAMLDFARLLIAIPYEVPSIENLLAPLVTRGQLHSTQEALWFLIRTSLEGITGLVLIISGGLMAVGRERKGTQLGMISLVTWITIINLLVFYFDQFGAVVIALVQFFVLTMLTYYRRVFLKLLRTFF